MKFLLIPLLLMLVGSPTTESKSALTMHQFCSLSPASCARMQREAWADTCRLSVYVCDGVSRPRLVFLPLAEDLSGVHVRGFDAVFVNSALDADWYAYAVIAHEMTHYLQHAHKASLSSCEREAEAFAVMNLVLAERGRLDLQRNKWRKLYRC